MLFLFIYLVLTFPNFTSFRFKFKPITKRLLLLLGTLQIVTLKIVETSLGNTSLMSIFSKTETHKGVSATLPQMNLGSNGLVETF